MSLGGISKWGDKRRIFIVLGSRLGDLKVDLAKKELGQGRVYDPTALDWVWGRGHEVSLDE